MLTGFPVGCCMLFMLNHLSVEWMFRDLAAYLNLYRYGKDKLVFD